MFSQITRTELLKVGKQISDGIAQNINWIKSFVAKISANNPKNALTKKEYGINWWNLGLNTLNRDFKTNYYATKKAWLSVGATIKDDEIKNGVQVFYWGQVGKKIKDEKTNDEKLKT